MASKKYSLLTCALFLLASYGFSQTTTPTGTGYDASDSSIIPSRSMPQHTEFMNGTYNYPAKPRNMWEFGVKGGLYTIQGDVTSRTSYGVGAHIRKAFGYLFSARLSYMQGIGKGLNWQRSTNYSRNLAWADRYNRAIGDVVYYNYRATVHDVALEGIFTLNNIRFHKAKSGVNLYALIGGGAMMYDTHVNALDEREGTDPFAGKYNFTNIDQGTWDTRKDVKDQLKDVLDDTYETQAENEADGRRPRIFGSTLRPVFHLGGGLAFKLSRRVNLAIEDRFTITRDDLLDGQRWAEQVSGQPVLTPDYDTYNHLTVGLNFNIGSRATEPLWWMNPLDYAYSEIRNPRLMRLPKPVLPDADGDGVTDQFDQEQTPAGVPVDVRGVSRDTDGDGVPDARDKEIITPTYCQPVDADGVGKCPCPDSSCFEQYMVRRGGACEATLGALPSITFTGNGARLSTDAQGLLASVAARLRNAPECRIAVTGYCASTKAEQQRSWDRVNTIINYMVEREGISQDRLVFIYAQEGGDCNTVDLRAATEADQTNNPVQRPGSN